MTVARKLLHVSTRPVADGLDALLRQRHWEVIGVRSLKAARSVVRREQCLAALLVLDAAGRDLAADLEACREANDACEWIAVLPPGALDSPLLREIVLQHFFDHHTQPADPQFLCQSIGHAFGRALLRQSHPAAGCDDLGLIGRSPAISHLRRHLRKAAVTDSPVLIEGETGTGKDLVARALHACSGRRDAPLVVLDGAGLADQPPDAFEAADGGTLVIDHAEEMPLDWQARLLRFMAEQAVLRAKLGRETRDARVVALCEMPLADAVAAKRFRQDLYFRLDVLRLAVPPLRQRTDDIVPLAHHFHAECMRRNPPAAARGFSREALAALRSHNWPGNVRELRNRVRRGVLLADQRLVGPGDLGLHAREAPRPLDSLEAMRVQAERQAIATSLDRASHNVSLAARELGVSRMTMYRLMAKHCIAPRELDRVA
jgi:two-component system, NtrC family, response regulator HydG